MAALGAATVFAATLLPRTGAFVALPPVSRTGHQLPAMSLGCRRQVAVAKGVLPKLAQSFMEVHKVQSEDHLKSIQRLQVE